MSFVRAAYRKRHTHNLRYNSHSIFKLGEMVDQEICHVGSKTPFGTRVVIIKLNYCYFMSFYNIILCYLITARRYLEVLPVDHVMVKLDFFNAFNITCIGMICLCQCSAESQSCIAYCHSAYSQPSTPLFGSYIISSLEGPRQGDPLGPLLFCNMIQPLLSSLSSELNLGYLDDVTLAGPV